ncbi:unnamed protein product [Prunus brigantina]
MSLPYLFLDSEVTSPIALSLAFIIFMFLVKFVLKTHNKNSVPIVALPPGPSPWPIVGCLPEMWRNRPAHRWIHSLMKKLNTDIACIRLGNVHVIPVTSPEIAREFLKKNDAVFASRPVTMATKTLSSGYLTTVVGPWGDQWRKMRRVLVAEAFNPSRVHWLLGKRNEENGNLIKKVWFRLLVLPTNIGMNAGKVGGDCKSQSGRYLIFLQNSINNYRREHIIHDDLSVDYVINVIKTQVHKKNPSNTVPFCVIWHYRTNKIHEDGNCHPLPHYQSPFNNAKSKDFVRQKDPHYYYQLISVGLCCEIIASAQSKPTYIHVLVHDQELQLATVDNPFNTAEWALSEMLNQPELLKKAEEELDRVVGKQRLVQESDVPKLPYVRACAREALRLHPVAPFNLPHMSSTDAVVAGYFIPKGSSVLLSRLGLGRNPEVWENPLRFDPERHLKGDADQQVDLEEHELRFITFSTGRRGCMGGGLGTTITIMLLSRLLQGFTWSMPHNVDKIDLTEALSLFKANPLFAHAKPRLPASLYMV